MDLKQIGMLNRVLLGLTMLVPGLLKLFVMKPAAIIDMLGGFGFPVPVFFAWVLILSEILFGIAILGNWKLRLTVWPPVVILVVATFTAHMGNWPNMLVHLTLASNYWLLGSHAQK
jgi:putative oxidoreductase